MSEQDKALVEQARHTIWENMYLLAGKCESWEAKQTIQQMEKEQAILEKCRMDA